MVHFSLSASRSTHSITLSFVFFDLFAENLVPIHGEEYEGRLETLWRLGSLAVLDWLLLPLRRWLLRPFLAHDFNV